jgi:hypothetical protein
MSNCTKLLIALGLINYLFVLVCVLLWLFEEVPVSIALR